MKIDITYRITAADSIPVDHGYALYSAISRECPAIHESDDLSIHPIAGRQTGNRRVRLTEFSRIGVRADVDFVRHLVPLAGKQLNVAGTRLTLGVPELRAITPSPILHSRLVVIKLSRAPTVPPDAFREAVATQLETLGIETADIVLGKRRTIRIKRREIVGYEVCFSALDSGDSLRIQEQGLGGRHRMGAGVFVHCSEARLQALQRLQTQTLEVAND